MFFERLIYFFVQFTIKNIINNCQILIDTENIMETKMKTKDKKDTNSITDEGSDSGKNYM